MESEAFVFLPAKYVTVTTSNPMKILAVSELGYKLDQFIHTLLA